MALNVNVDFKVKTITKENRKLYNDEWVSSPKRQNNPDCECVYQKSFKIQEAKWTERKGNKQINP